MQVYRGASAQRSPRWRIFFSSRQKFLFLAGAMFVRFSSSLKICGRVGHRRFYARNFRRCWKPLWVVPPNPVQKKERSWSKIAPILVLPLFLSCGCSAKKKTEKVWVKKILPQHSHLKLFFLLSKIEYPLGYRSSIRPNFTIQFRGS